jgi:hypothetical protein
MAGSQLANHLERLKGESNDEHLTRQEYMATHLRCAVCYWPANRVGRCLELHHIVGGPGRYDIPGGANWVTLCSLCHRSLHDKVAGICELPRGAILAAKLEEDGELDIDLLASLKHRKALPYDICPVPDEYKQLRSKNGGPAWPV